MADTPDGAEVLKQLHLEEPIIADYEKDYRYLESIDIEGMTDWGK
jgi:hypothetical protein